MEVAMAAEAESEVWRKVFHAGVAPRLSTPGLLALRDALRGDDPRLTQGSTTTPPPLQCVMDWPCEGACLIGYAFWVGDRGGKATVGEVEELFARACHGCDDALHEPAAVRHVLNWFDETPRAAMIAALLPEVEAELARRRAGGVGDATL
jgi:hypothetical protein